MTAPQIVWLRRDLRLADQPAFAAAARSGPVVPVFVLDERAGDGHAYGGASRWWLHHSLNSLARDLSLRGLRLILRRGEAARELSKLAQEVGSGAIHALRHYEPWWRKVQGALAKGPVPFHLHDGNYLLPPGSVTTGAGTPYKIYSPFARALMERMPPPVPLDAPGPMSAPDKWPESDRLEDWRLLPARPDWAGGLREFWAVGETAAQERLEEWSEQVGDYDRSRNLPAVDGSSRLSAHLNWGEVSARQVWHAVAGRGKGREVFLKELVWRDYAQNVIAENFDYPSKSYRDGYDGLWRSGPEADEDLERWQRGITGYPIVDAGMRQLWRTGWMHNRVRMICASFLVKHLLIDWRKGEQWFWDTLVDADYGNNGVNWQWIAGTGVDSNMFVRIMAPLTQSAKFEAADYIREYVPELAHLSDREVHDPPEDRRGDYPAKMIGHAEARERALSAYRAARQV